jgi:hypothetical protein
MGIRDQSGSPHRSLELNETAYLLGYEDSNSFFRAFHQWEAPRPVNGERFMANLRMYRELHWLRSKDTSIHRQRDLAVTAN